MGQSLKAYKMNAIALAKHHRETCPGETCDVSLLMLRLMAEEVGVVFTKEEAELFI